MLASDKGRAHSERIISLYAVTTREAGGLREKSQHLQTHLSPKDAYKLFLLSYTSHQLQVKDIFNIYALGWVDAFTRPCRVITTS